MPEKLFLRSLSVYLKYPEEISLRRARKSGRIDEERPAAAQPDEEKYLPFPSKWFASQLLWLWTDFFFSFSGPTWPFSHAQQACFKVELKLPSYSLCRLETLIEKRRFSRYTFPSFDAGIYPSKFTTFFICSFFKSCGEELRLFAIKLLFQMKWSWTISKSNIFWVFWESFQD